MKPRLSLTNPHDSFNKMFSQMVYYLIEMINEYIIIDTLPNDTNSLLMMMTKLIKQKNNKTREITNNKDFI